jgi:hypothetical protein
MSKLLIALIICVFSTSSFSVNAADKVVPDLKKSQITPIQSQSKPADNDFRDKPLTNQTYQIQASDKEQARRNDGSPAKPTEVDYIQPPNLNDRNPISN